jgi:hypothetical protein
VALGVEFIAHPGERLLFRQQALPRRKPLRAGYNFILHAAVSIGLHGR